MAETLTLKKRGPVGFLGQFTLERRMLSRADRSKGIPSLRAGVDKTGHPVLIKTWARDESDDEIREIWRNEIRQLHRLAGYPGVSDYIVELQGTGEDETGFHLVLSPGQRRPLASLLRDDHSGTWSARAKVPQDRMTIWRNLQRIANGLDLLHSQGLLHRNLNAWSVLTAGKEEPDFQLTGFEWSMRLVGADTQLIRRGPSGMELSESFTRDWLNFGELASTLLAFDAKKLANLSVANHDVSEFASADEARLLRELLQLVPSRRIDGQLVGERISAIVTALSIRAQRKEPGFHLVVALGRANSLTNAIREASGREIDVDDASAQLEYIKNDLYSPIAVAAKIAGRPDSFSLLLRGQNLSYTLEDYNSGQGQNSSNWDFAYCGRAECDLPFEDSIINRTELNPESLRLISLSEAKTAYRRYRGRVGSWEELRRELRPPTEAESAPVQMRKSLMLTQIIEYLFAASEMFPVKVVRTEAAIQDDEGGRTALFVIPREDADRERLSEALGLAAPSRRFGEAVESDRAEDTFDGPLIWTLTDKSLLGDRSAQNTEWRFESKRDVDDGSIEYCFRGDNLAPSITDAFLIADSSIGRDSQLKRRLRSFQVLAEHAELSRMLLDPRSRVVNSEETVEEDAFFLALDPSKQQALKLAIETLPLFLVQGPPGVGKTRLVRDLVRRRFSEDVSTRLLLSAQSNYAVDHLLSAIQEIFPSESTESPLIVRCTAKDKKEQASAFDVGQQSKKLLSGLLRSELYSNATPGMRERLTQLGKSVGLEGLQGIDGSATESTEYARRALEGLVLRAANLVFATTNSGDLERLIDERAQFDWAIVEEAGKATGGELVSPLLLSHRRLMIGDHQQLPPFGTERILKLFETPQDVRAALKLGDSMIGRTFRDTTVDGIFVDGNAGGEDETDRTFSDLCAMASRNFTLFETIIENEFERQKSGRGRRPIATQLTAQHRMHPAIASIVSTCFYNELTTDPSREAEFRANPSPISSIDLSRLPDAPVVWIDMPYLQSTFGMKKAERLPRYCNDQEVDAVTRVLEIVRLNPKSGRKASLAVLSPYKRQVDLLARRINSLLASKLNHLLTFSASGRREGFCNTVDSFQGNEADLVIVSLVRNNHHGSIWTALGFLADERRMNVLLSRARWKLVVVGSLDFLATISQTPKPVEDAEKSKFLVDLLKLIHTGNSPDFAVVSYEKLCGVSQ
ncbi:AAA domain-containing protein [Burkholderia vietnamiensis]|uniref:AAA domain-containing protein n=1 Tax=Burkholderia vietnamiensis TaxID=60552 RepID=UPI00158DDF40|nr:AAA domain-containing protein [Burkholderia vietnamiensis]